MAVEVAKESEHGSSQEGSENGAAAGRDIPPRAFTERGRTLIEAIVAEHGSYSHAATIAGILASQEGS